MFETGDGVLHPVHGAGVVTEIRPDSVSGEARTYYVIEMVAGKMRLFVPVESADEIGLRRGPNRLEGEELLAAMSALAEVLPEEYKARQALMDSALGSEDDLRKAELLRDLAWRGRRQGFSAGGLRAYRRLRQLLSGEVALATGTDLPGATTRVEEALERSREATQTWSSGLGREYPHGSGRDRSPWGGSTVSGPSGDG